MIENYIDKTASKPESFCHDNGDYLREWQKDLVFYWSGELEKADYALYNKTPTFDVTPTIMSGGRYGNYSRVKSPIVFDPRNLESLADNIHLSFCLGANSVNGFYTIYLKPKKDFHIEGGDYSFTVQADGEISRQLRLTLKEGTTFAQLRNRLSFELDPSLYGVELDFNQSTEDTIAIKAASLGKVLKIFDGTDGISLLSKLDISDTSYGMVPKSEKFDIIKLENEYNSLIISHTRELENGKTLSKLRFTYGSGEEYKTTSILWNNNGLDLDHVEVDIDSSVMYVFLNGKLSKAVLISPIKRTANPTTLTINGTEDEYYSIEELIIKDELQHKEDFEVSKSQLTKYDSSIPYIDYSFASSKLKRDSLMELVHDCSDGISMVLNYKGSFYYYNNGSWRISNGSFEKSNDHYTFGDYIKDFSFDGSNEMFIRAYFESDGDEPQYIKDLRFTISSESIYEEDNKTAAILIGQKTFEPEYEIITGEDSHSDDQYPYDPSPDDIEVEEGKLIHPIIDLKNKDITIKTDLGTTKLVFPDNMTLDEALTFIESNYPEGISKVYKDSLYRPVLVSETKGDQAFVKVSGVGGDLLFGAGSTAQGTDQTKNTLEDNYKKFIEDVKEYSSEDLIPIEIKDSQVRMYLKEAINLYKKYRNDELNTYNVQLKGDADKGYEIPPVVEDWHDITDILFRPLFPLGFYTGSFDNDAEDIIELSLVNAMGGVDYSQFYGKGFQTDYYISLMNIESMEQILGLTPSWRVYNNRLYIFPNNISKYTTVTIVYKAPVDPVKALRDPYIIQYVYGKIRMAQGEVRGQYGANLSSGGLAVQFNADTMYERGRDAVEKAVEEMKKQQDPLGFIVG